MTAAFDDERIIDQVDRAATTDPQPEVVIFAGRQRFIESPHGIQQPAAHHDG